MWISGGTESACEMLNTCIVETEPSHSTVDELTGYVIICFELVP